MGCGRSKLEQQNVMPYPYGMRRIQDKIEKMKRRRKVMNVSIVSRAQLLGPGDRERMVEEVEEEIVEKGIVGEIVMVVENEKEMKKEDVVQIEELPGSPSFRIYIREAVVVRDFDDDPDKVIQYIKEGRLNEPVKISKQLEAEQDMGCHQICSTAPRVKDRIRSESHKVFQKTVNRIMAEKHTKEKERAQSTHAKESTITQRRRHSFEALIPKEGSVTKHSKKDKGKRFKSFTKAFTVKTRHTRSKSDTSIHEIN